MARKRKTARQRLLDLLDEIDDDDEPSDDDDAGPGRLENVNVTIDLSDEAAVERGIGLGLLTRAEAAGGDDDEPEDEEPPSRSSGFFKEGKGK